MRHCAHCGEPFDELHESERHCSYWCAKQDRARAKQRAERFLNPHYPKGKRGREWTARIKERDHADM